MPGHRFSLRPCTAPPPCSLQPLLKLSLLSLGPSLLQFVSIDSLLLNHENTIFEPVCVFYLLIYYQGVSKSYFEPKTGGEVRIFGLYNKKTKEKKRRTLTQGEIKQNTHTHIPNSLWECYRAGNSTVILLLSTICVLNFSGGLVVWRCYKQTKKNCAVQGCEPIRQLVEC